MRISVSVYVNQPEVSLVVGDAFRSAVLGRTLQHHNVDSPGCVASACPDTALPVPSKARLDVRDGQRTNASHRKKTLYCFY